MARNRDPRRLSWDEPAPGDQLAAFVDCRKVCWQPRRPPGLAAMREAAGLTPDRPYSAELVGYSRESDLFDLLA